MCITALLSIYQKNKRLKNQNKILFKEMYIEQEELKCNKLTNKKYGLRQNYYMQRNSKTDGLDMMSLLQNLEDSLKKEMIMQFNLKKKKCKEYIF